MTTKWDLRFLNLARLISTWSRDPSTKTGAVIVRPNKSVAGVGFNGFPQGMPDNEEWYANRNEKYSRVVHCEVNALLFANGPIEGACLYTYPFLSCDRCFVQMAQAGIKRFVAPKPTLDAISRWGEALDRVREYVAEMNLKICEYDLGPDTNDFCYHKFVA